MAGHGRASLTAAVAAAAFALAGCGSGGPTKQDVVARANAICADAVRGIRAIPAPAGGQASLPALAGYLRRVLPIVEQEVTGLRALPRPSPERGLLDRYITAVTSSGSEYRVLASAAARGDRGAVAAALSALEANPDEGLAARYGLGQCAGTTGTGVS